MQRELRDFLNLYKGQLSEHMYEEFLADIEQDYYLDIYELADDLEDVGVDLDKIG